MDVRIEIAAAANNDDDDDDDDEDDDDGGGGGRLSAAAVAADVTGLGRLNRTPTGLDAATRAGWSKRALAPAPVPKAGSQDEEGGRNLVDEDVYRRYFNTPIAVHTSTGYPRLGTNVSLHQLVQPLPNGFDVIDHRNGNKLDNRRANLRPASWATNARSKLPRSNTGHLGISQDPNGLYRAHVMTADGPITKRHRTLSDAIAWKEREERIHHPEDFE